MSSCYGGKPGDGKKGAEKLDYLPLKVTLNEYIELSKYYSTPKSNGFINGILDELFTKLKKDGTIKKSGRGLIE